MVAVVATITQVHQNAAAATISEREVVKNVVFELSDDNIVGITFRERNFRLEDNLDAAPKDFTKEKVDAALAEEQKTVKETLGWDVASDDDFDKFRTEVNQLRRALNEALSSPNLPKNYKEAWTGSLNIIDQLLAVECRGRCLPPGETVDNVIAAGAVGAAISAMIGEFADPSLDPEFLETALTVIAIIQTLFLFVIFDIVPDLFDIRPGTLRTAVVAVAGALLMDVHRYGEDARTIAAAQSPPTTPKASMKDGAKRIADQTPTQDDNPKDYDVIHDEL